MVTAKRFGRVAWFGRLVSLPGTLDDIKAWRGVLLAAVVSVLRLWDTVRERLAEVAVSRAEWVASIDTSLWLVGTVAIALTGLMFVAMVWNTYKARRKRRVLSQPVPIPHESAYEVLNYWGETGDPLRDALSTLGRKKYPKTILVKETGKIEEIPYPPVHNRIPGSRVEKNH